MNELEPEPLEIEPIDAKMALLQGIANAALSGAIDADQWEALLKENGFEENAEEEKDPEDSDSPPVVERSAPVVRNRPKDELF